MSKTKDKIAEFMAAHGIFWHANDGLPPVMVSYRAFQAIQNMHVTKTELKDGTGVIQFMLERPFYCEAGKLYEAELFSDGTMIMREAHGAVAR